MATLVTLECRAKDEESAAQLKAMMAERFPETRAYDGCQGITGYLQTDDPLACVLVEFWDSSEHYNKYLAWREETGVLAQLGELLEGPPNIRHFEAMDA